MKCQALDHKIVKSSRCKNKAEISVRFYMGIARVVDSDLSVCRECASVSLVLWCEEYDCIRVEGLEEKNVQQSEAG